MVMPNSAHAYQEAYAPETRRMRVLNGSVACAREAAKRSIKIRIALVITAVFVYLLGTCLFNAGICGMGVELNTLKADIAQTENMIARADLEYGEMESLDRVEAYAIENLGMVYPGATDVYILNEDSSLQIAQGQEEIALTNGEDTTVEKNPRWQTFVNGFTEFFSGTASAAENQSQ